MNGGILIIAFNGKGQFVRAAVFCPLESNFVEFDTHMHFQHVRLRLNWNKIG